MICSCCQVDRSQLASKLTGAIAAPRLGRGLYSSSIRVGAFGQQHLDNFDAPGLCRQVKRSRSGMIRGLDGGAMRQENIDDGAFTSADRDCQNTLATRNRV